MANENQWCFIWDPNHEPGSGTTRAALVNKNKWTGKNPTINVGFLDGDTTVQDRIREAVKEWTAPGMAEINLVFLKNPDNADVRISFQYPGSWSTIGTSCRSVPKPQPTMNYGWLKPQTPDAELRRVVLHEFGHALGLIHEHQSSGTAIPWNKPNVYRDLSGPPNNWDKTKIDHNMFEAYSKDETSFTAVDTKSIMMYPIPASWVTDPDFAVGLNTDLSATDKSFIHKQYS